MSAELTALHTASSSSVSLLENCAIVFVPLIDALLLRRLPDKKTAASTIAAFLGVLCLALEQGGLSGGIFWGLAAALIYACAIILTARFSHESEDPLCIGVVQVGTMGVLALVASLLFESPVLPQTAPQWGMVAALALVEPQRGYQRDKRCAGLRHAHTDGRPGALLPHSPRLDLLRRADTRRERRGNRLLQYVRRRLRCP